MFIRYNGKNEGNILFVCKRIIKVDDWTWEYPMENDVPKYTDDQLKFIDDLYWLEEIVDTDSFSEYRKRRDTEIFDDNPNPYIYQLPEDIQRLALKRQYEQGYREDRMVRLNTFNFEGVFNWNLTDEGMEFWELINIGEYDVFYKLYPGGKGF